MFSEVLDPGFDEDDLVAFIDRLQREVCMGGSIARGVDVLPHHVNLANGRDYGWLREWGPIGH